MLKKKRKIHKTSKIWNITILWTTLVETLPSTICFFGSESVVYFSGGDVIWIFSSQMVPYISENEKVPKELKI